MSDQTSQTTYSPRQELAYKQRDAAARHQVFRRHYDVPSGTTPDEENFPRAAASFHKLLQHDDATGLLTDGTADDAGTVNYKRLLKGLMVAQPSSDFDSQALYELYLQSRSEPPTPCRDRPDLPPHRYRVLINPRSSKALSIKGPDITSLRVSRILYCPQADYGQEVCAADEERLLKEISFASEFTAAEMAEVYAMALLRNRLLGEYADSPDADLAIDTLNEFGKHFVWGYDAEGRPITADTLKVTEQNLFRGPTPGDRAGDYLSVFLTFLRPPLFPSGCAPFVADLIGASKFATLLGEQLMVPQGQDRDFVRTFKEYVRVQNGFIPEEYPDGFFTGRTPIRTGRDLGNYVHVDNVYEEYIRAADILVGGQYPRSPNFPYALPCPDDDPRTCYRNEGDGPTLGPSDVYGLLGGVREVAERAAFTQKWLVARRARPEVLGGLIDLVRSGRDSVGGRLPASLVSDSGTAAKLLARVYKWNESRCEGDPGCEGNYLLSQMYPEGSPAHPAWPSGHATVAGACVTVLKALFDDRLPILDPNHRPGRCEEPRAYVAPNGDRLTVGGELDKLASNVSLGRNFGGVHFRSDGEHGILLGEEVAIRYLQDHARTYREHFRDCDGFTLTRRNGVRICITPESVRVVPAIGTFDAEAQKPAIIQKSLL